MSLPAKERFLERFRGLMRALGTYKVTHKSESKKGKMEGIADTRQEPVTLDVWDMHLNGKRSLGIVPIDDDGNCHFGAIDVDEYEALDLAQIESKVESLKLPLIVCRTKSGGAHLYFFGSEPIPAKVLRPRLMEFAIVLGYPGVEIFPKQTQLASGVDTGNWINLPYFGGVKTNRYAIRKGKQLSPTVFLNYATKKAQTQKELVAVKIPAIENLPEAPPCLEHLARNGVPDGARNSALFSFGVYAKLSSGDDWEPKLDKINREFLKPPLPSKEVNTITISLSKKNYSYKCKDEPLASCCNRAMCVKRKFGIGGNDDPGVNFDALVKIDSKPPTWIISIDGQRIGIKDTGVLLNQDHFRLLCVEELNILPAKIGGKHWDNIIAGLLGRVDIIEAPDDAGAEGQFRQLLESFCTGKAQARDREQLILGLPWQEKGRIFFRSNDLLKYLEQERFREITKSTEVWAALRRLGAEHGEFNIKKACVRVWSVPVDLFTTFEGDLDVPRVAGAGKEEF